MKKKYYLQDKQGHAYPVMLESDEEAFRLAQEKNRRNYQGWKAYNDRGDLIYFVYDGRNNREFPGK